jgi:hypothetical protein
LHGGDDAADADPAGTTIPHRHSTRAVGCILEHPERPDVSQIQARIDVSRSGRVGRAAFAFLRCICGSAASGNGKNRNQEQGWEDQRKWFVVFMDMIVFGPIAENFHTSLQS